MSKHRPTTKDEHIDYCLRALGDGVIQINVSDDQIEDRVQQSLQYFRDHHPEGQYRLYVPHQLTDSDVSNGYISLGNEDLDVISVFPVGSVTGAGSGMFNVKYQMLLNDVIGFYGSRGSYVDLAYYEQMNQYLTLLDMKLTGGTQIHYNRQSDRLYLLGETASGDLISGNYLMIEAYSYKSDSDNATTTLHSIWNNEFLKEYTTALIKKQWGNNLAKFDGVTLPGGVTISGREIKEEAENDIEKAITKFRSEQEEPLGIFIG